MANLHGTQTIELTAPASWASYFVNGDASGLTDEEQDAADKFYWDADGEVVQTTDAGFLHRHDAYKWYPHAADCATYTFIKYR